MSQGGAQRIVPAGVLLRRSAVAAAVLQERLRRFSARQIDRWITRKMLPALLRDIDRAINAGAAGTWDARRKIQLVRSMAETYSTGLTELRPKIETAMTEAAEIEVRQMDGALEKVLPAEVKEAGFRLGPPDLDEVRRRALNAEASGQTISEVVDLSFSGLPERHANRIDEEIKRGFVEGVNPRVVAARIRRNVGAEVGNMTRARASTVARTAMNAAANEAREAQFAADAELYKGVQWVATLDARTTRQCGVLDGKVFPMDSGPRPPLHFNCRSTTVPILKSLSEMGLGEDDGYMDGGVPERQSYEDWLKDQPNDTQDEILGQQTAAAFRSGKVKLEETLDRFGSPLSATEIKAGKGGGFLRETGAKDLEN